MIGEPGRRGTAAGRIPRRRIDVVEEAVAWALSSLALLLVVVAVTAAFATYGRVAEQAEIEAADRVAVRAELLEPAPVRMLEPGHPMPSRATATWTAPDGTPRTGRVPVPGPAPAGRTVVVWVDGRGDVVTAPPTGLEAVAAALLTAVWILALGGAALGIAWALTRRAVAAAGCRRWEREWSAVGPHWTGHRHDGR